MRVTRQQAARNRGRIVAAAARLFRERGFDGVGVDAIMRHAGLTHGGFYGHFASKDALAAEATARALDDSMRWQDGLGSLHELLLQYLSMRHREDRAKGCPVAALGGDVARQGPAARLVLTAGIRAQVSRIAGLLKSGTPKARRRQAIATYAGMVGALVLARAVAEPALAEEILAATRDTFGEEHAA
ncbi:MAG: TetR/AcrR family transcriptional regulator [Pseudomonadota bacterium]